MIRPWARALARQWQMMSRPVRRRSARPRVEVLEDRTLTSTMNIDPPLVFTGSQAQHVPAGSLRFEFHSGATAPAATTTPNLPGPIDPALERILEDIRKQDAVPAVTYFVAGVPEGGSNDNPLIPTGFTSPLDLQKAEPSVVPSSPSERVAQFDKNFVPRVPVQPGADPNDPTSTDAGRAHMPPAAAVAAAETHSLPTQPNSASWAAAGIAHPVPNQVILSSPTLVVPSQPGQSPFDLPGSETNGVAPESRHAGVVEVYARTDIRGVPGDLPDGKLLQRFVADGEQAAFTALVQRYEQMVLGVCQNVLGDAHAAQDAFQATFLVLARKANLIDSQNPLAAWLYKVAYHLALRLRAVAARQRRHEKDAATGRSHEEHTDCPSIEKQELCQALNEELQRLPEKYRLPLVLCYFEGLTHEEAARAIGLPRGSMAKRIGEGLERLRDRLLDRGFMP
jgi:RNA polymerase sigma factor (sigma-70 family)